VKFIQITHQFFKGLWSLSKSWPRTIGIAIENNGQHGNGVQKKWYFSYRWSGNLPLVPHSDARKQRNGSARMQVKEARKLGWAGDLRRRSGPPIAF
jgi:hypothetical protein